MTHQKSHKRRKNLFVAPIITLGVLTLGVAAWYSLPRAVPVPLSINQVGNASGTVDLNLSPASLSLTPDTESTLTLGFNAGTNHLSAAQIELSYDSSQVGTPTVTLGSTLTAVLSGVSLANNKITFTVGAPTGSGGVTGSGELATIKIKPPIVGSSSLSFTTNTLVTTTESQTNALKSANDVTVVVAAAAASAPASAPASATPSISPSPSPSLSPSPSPSPSPTPSTPPAVTPPTTLRSSASCNSLSFTWDKLNVGNGYVITLADNPNFDNQVSSGSLSSNTTSFAFNNLKSGTQYSARVTANGIPDFPHYTTLTVKTNTSCTAPVTQATSTPTPKTPTPTKSPVKATPLFATTPTPTSTPSYNPQTDRVLLVSPSPAGLLNDIFGGNVPSTDSSTTENPNFFQKIILGWQVILNKIASAIFPTTPTPVSNP